MILNVARLNMIRYLKRAFHPPHGFCRHQWSLVVLGTGDSNTSAIISIVTSKKDETMSVKTLTSLVHLNPTVSSRSVQVEFELVIPGCERVRLNHFQY